MLIGLLSTISHICSYEYVLGTFHEYRFSCSTLYLKCAQKIAHTLKSVVLNVTYMKLSRVWKSQVARQERKKRLYKLYFVFVVVFKEEIS